MNAYRRIISFLMTGLAAVTMLAHAQPSRAEAAETLGPGDSIRVTVFQNPDLTTETRISAQGTIRMPLIGIVDLKGLTTSDAVNRIASRLKKGQYLNDPQVSVALLQVRSRQASVLGQVTRPGRYALDDTSTRLTDVIALAGGVTPTGDDVATIITTRNGKAQRLRVDVARMVRDADMADNIEIRNGDTIYVHRAPVFYIYGEVNRAGSYRLDERLSVVQALSLGGGISLRGTERGIKIHRRAEDGSLLRIDAKPGDLVQADDVIYVRESLF